MIAQPLLPDDPESTPWTPPTRASSSPADILPFANATLPAPAHGPLALADVSRRLFNADSVLDTLQRIVDVSVETVRGCDGASVSFVQGDAIVTPVWTEDAVIETDRLQYTSGEGPCLDAIAQGATIHAADLSSDPRWRLFGPQAARRGFHSLLSLRLATDRTFGSLNLYSRRRAAYDPLDHPHALAFSIHASVALAAADALEAARRSWADESKRLAHVERALSSNQTITLAQGILMGTDGINAHEAFTVLRCASVRGNRKLLDVAQCVLETGRVEPRTDQVDR